MLRAFIRLSCAITIVNTGGILLAQVPTAPVITSLSPTNRTMGDPGFNLFVNGSGFNSCTRVRWNGQDLNPTNPPGTTTISGQVIPALLSQATTVTVTAFRYNVISGTVATCASTGVSSNSLTFIITSPLMINSASPLPPARIAQSYPQYQFEASGGRLQGTYTWGVTSGSTLPPGFNLSQSGLLTGTPGQFQLGTYTFTVGVVDCVIECTPPAHVASKVFTLTVQNAINISPATIPGGAVCANYSQQFTVSGGVSPYTLTATGLPAGLTFNPSNNTISGRPTQTGTSQVTVRATDAQNQSTSQLYSLVVAGSQFQIGTATLPSGRVGTAYNQTLLATGGQQPYTWTATSGIPPGLSVGTVSNNGQIAGTPTQAGTFSTLFRVVDAGSCEATRTITIPIALGDLQIVTSALNPGQVGTSYSQTLQGQGGTSPYTWSITSAQVPGLTLSGGGVLSGTPTAAGSFRVTVLLADSAQARITRDFTIVVTAPLTITTPSLNSGSIGTSYSQTLQASGGTSPYSWSIASGQVPGLTLSNTGTLSGLPQTPGTFPLTIQVMDSAERTATRNYTVQVASSVTIVTTSLNPGSAGTAYTQPLQAAGGSPPYSWSLASGQLPPGLSLNGAGVIGGIPQTPGSFSFVAQVVDNAQGQASRNFTLQITSGLSITTSALLSARVGQPYEQILQATGNSGGLTWSALTGLPPGFTLATNGLLAGTGTSTGDFSITFQVQDASGAVATRTLLLNVLNSLVVVTESLPNAQAGVAYSTTLSASGGNPPYRWQAIGELPAGLTLDPFGLLSGTPAQTGSFPVQVQVIDSTGGNATKPFTLVVGSQFRITTEGLPNGSVGVFYNSSLQAAGGRLPIRWGLDSGQLPLGLILNSNTGAVAGTPQEAGEFRFTIFANDADLLRTTRSYTVTIRGQFTITTQTLPGGTVGTGYSQTLSTNGGASPFRWAVTEGALPAGLQLGGATGVIAGTPTAAGTFDFVIQATDNGNLQARQQYSLVINARGFTITTSSLPNGTVGTAYSQTIAILGGATPIRWSVAEGSLPGGLQLGAATGAITGTPTVAGVSNFTVLATDNANAQARQPYTVTIIGPPQITTQSLPAGVLNAPYVAVVEATGGEAPYTWSQTGLPEGLALDAASGEISGTPVRAGSFNLTITVRDQGSRNASRQFTIMVASGLTIVIESLPAGRVGVAYNQTLEAAGGGGGLTWTVSAGTLPAGVTLAANGNLQGTPSRGGDFNFTVQVRDSQGNTATRPLSLRVAELTLSGITIRSASLQTGAGDQPAIVLELTDPAPALLTGTLALTFASDAGATDPALQFSQGATPRFTIAEGSRTAVFTGGALNLQLGTIAGTATIAARISAGGVDVTPTPAPSLVIRIDRGVPVINTMTLSRTANMLTVDLTGFATSRELTSADFQFAIRQGATVQTSNFTVQLTAPFVDWYRDTTRSLPFGSAFRLTMPFNVTGSTADITGVTVILVNAVGRSQPRTGSF